MLMVIFGAGASHDSASDFPLPHRFDGDTGGPWRPPLAKDLFRNAQSAFGYIVKKYAKLPHIMVVGGDPRDAQATLEYFVTQIGKQIGRDLLARNCSTGSGGFTQFVTGREAEGFLA